MGRLVELGADRCKEQTTTGRPCGGIVKYYVVRRTLPLAARPLCLSHHQLGKYQKFPDDELVVASLIKQHQESAIARLYRERLIQDLNRQSPVTLGHEYAATEPASQREKDRSP